MDIQALLLLAAYCCKNGRDTVALDILKQASQCDDFASQLSNCIAPATPGCANPASGDMVADGGNEGSGIDGLDNFVDYVDNMPNRAARVGGVPASENTFSPSLHGDDTVAFGQVLSIASAVFSQKLYLHDGDELIVDPQLGAFASDALDAYDDEALVRVNVEKTETLKPGRITIRL
jgi:hypothetical protein